MCGAQRCGAVVAVLSLSLAHFVVILRSERALGGVGRRRGHSRRSGRSSSIGGESNLRVDLGVGVVERLLRGGVEPAQRHANRLRLVSEHDVRLADVDEAASGNHLVTRTFHECLAEHIRPLGQVVREHIVHGTELLHGAEQDLLLGRLASVLLLVGVVETVKHRFVQDASAGEPTRLVTLTLRVRGGEHREPGLRHDPLVDLLEVDSLTLKHRLKAHELVAAEVDLVKQQHGATLHRKHNGAIVPLHATVDEAETTEQIVLVSLRHDVDAEALAPQLGADLFDHRGLAVTRQTRDEHRGEHPGTQNLLNVGEVTPRHILGADGGDERRTLATRHTHDRRSGAGELHGRSGDLGRRRRNRHRLHRSGFGLEDLRRGADRNAGSVSSATDLGDVEHPATGVARGVLDDPRGRELLPDAVRGAQEILTRHGRDGRDGGESGNERGLLCRESRHRPPVYHNRQDPATPQLAFS